VLHTGEFDHPLPLPLTLTDKEYPGSSQNHSIAVLREIAKRPAARTYNRPLNPGDGAFCIEMKTPRLSRPRRWPQATGFPIADRSQAGVSALHSMNSTKRHHRFVTPASFRADKSTMSHQNPEVSRLDKKFPGPNPIYNAMKICGETHGMAAHHESLQKGAAR